MKDIKALLYSGIMIYMMGWSRQYLQFIFSLILKSIKDMFLVSLTIKDDSSSAFQIIYFYICENMLTKNHKHIKYVNKNLSKLSKYYKHSKTENTQKNSIFLPLDGTFYIIHKNTYIHVCINTNMNISAMKNDKSTITTIKLWTYARDVSILKNFVEYIMNENERNTHKKIKVLMAVGYHSVGSPSYVRKRTIESLILKNGIIKDICDDIKLFRSKKQWYINMGIPYQRGYILHGPPGCGKTSLIKAIASYFNSEIFIFDLKLSKKDLIYTLSILNSKTILVIEDVDCLFKKRNDETDTVSGSEPPNYKESNMTLSDFLNAIDGITANDDTLIIMTTNHIGLLDPALIRKGRIDRIIEIDFPDIDQLERMYLRFFPNAVESGNHTKFAENVMEQHPDGISMSSIQEHLIRKNDNEKSALYDPIAS